MGRMIFLLWGYFVGILYIALGLYFAVENPGNVDVWRTIPTGAVLIALGIRDIIRTEKGLE